MQADAAPHDDRRFSPVLPNHHRDRRLWRHFVSIDVGQLREKSTCHPANAGLVFGSDTRNSGASHAGIQLHHHVLKGNWQQRLYDRFAPKPPVPKKMMDQKAGEDAGAAGIDPPASFDANVSGFDPPPIGTCGITVGKSGIATVQLLSIQSRIRGSTGCSESLQSPSP